MPEVQVRGRRHRRPLRRRSNGSVPRRSRGSRLRRTRGASLARGLRRRLQGSRSGSCRRRRHDRRRGGGSGRRILHRRRNPGRRRSRRSCRPRRCRPRRSFRGFRSWRMRRRRRGHGTCPSCWRRRSFWTCRSRRGAFEGRRRVCQHLGEGFRSGGGAPPRRPRRRLGLCFGLRRRDRAGRRRRLLGAAIAGRFRPWGGCGSRVYRGGRGCCVIAGLRGLFYLALLGPVGPLLQIAQLGEDVGMQVVRRRRPESLLLLRWCRFRWQIVVFQHL
jgi:hypothetical protein